MLASLSKNPPFSENTDFSHTVSHDAYGDIKVLFYNTFAHITKLRTHQR